MPRTREQPPPATAVAALSGLTVDVLRTLSGAATGHRGGARKAELVASVARALAGDGPRRLYETLGEMERAAVAEAVHATDGRFDSTRFRARYGSDPHWGSLGRGGQSSATVLDVLFCGSRTLPIDVRNRLRGVVPEPVASRVRPSG